MRIQDILNGLYCNMLNMPILKEMLIKGEKKEAVIAINCRVTLLTKQIDFLNEVKKGLQEEINNESLPK